MCSLVLYLCAGKVSTSKISVVVDYVSFMFTLLQSIAGITIMVSHKTFLVDLRSVMETARATAVCLDLVNHTSAVLHALSRHY